MQEGEELENPIPGAMPTGEIDPSTLPDAQREKMIDDVAEDEIQKIHAQKNEAKQQIRVQRALSDSSEAAALVANRVFAGTMKNAADRETEKLSKLQDEEKQIAWIRKQIQNGVPREKVAAELANEEFSQGTRGGEMSSRGVLGGREGDGGMGEC